jgi:hypothetical protein
MSRWLGTVASQSGKMEPTNKPWLATRRSAVHGQPDSRRVLCIAGEAQNVRSGFEAAVVRGASGKFHGRTTNGRGRIRRVVAKPTPRSDRGWMVGEAADWLQIPR